MESKLDMEESQAHQVEEMFLRLKEEAVAIEKRQLYLSLLFFFFVFLGV